MVGLSGYLISCHLKENRQKKKKKEKVWGKQNKKVKQTNKKNSEIKQQID